MRNELLVITNLFNGNLGVHYDSSVDSVLQVKVGMGPVFNWNRVLLLAACSWLILALVSFHYDIGYPGYITNMVPRHRLDIQKEELQSEVLVLACITLDAPGL